MFANFFSEHIIKDMASPLFQKEDYTCQDCLVERNVDKEYAPHHKAILLKECLSTFCGKGELPTLDEFVFEENTEEEEDFTRCICSQVIKNSYFIRHKETGIRFKIGSDCFQKLFGKAQCDEIHFFKPLCINCKKEKVLSRRTNAGKLGCCSEKCKNIYNKKIHCQSCGNKFWRLAKHHTVCKPCFLKSFYSNVSESSAKYRIF